MGHETGYVALAVANAGDVADRAVGIADVVSFLYSRKVTDGTFGSGVAENDLAIFLEFGERGFVAIVITVGVRDGNLENLALLRGVGKRRIRLLDADVHVAADEAQGTIAHHRAREQTRFAKNLEPVANTQNHAAALRKFLDRLHYRGKTRDGARAKIIAVGKSAGQDDGVAICEVF